MRSRHHAAGVDVGEFAAAGEVGRTIDVTCCGRFASFAKFAVAMGNWVDPTPVISTLTRR